MCCPGKEPPSFPCFTRENINKFVYPNYKKLNIPEFPRKFGNIWLVVPCLSFITRIGYYQIWNITNKRSKTPPKWTLIVYLKDFNLNKTRYRTENVSLNPLDFLAVRLSGRRVIFLVWSFLTKTNSIENPILKNLLRDFVLNKYKNWQKLKSQLKRNHKLVRHTLGLTNKEHSTDFHLSRKMVHYSNEGDFMHCQISQIKTTTRNSIQRITFFEKSKHKILSYSRNRQLILANSPTLKFPMDMVPLTLMFLLAAKVIEAAAKQILINRAYSLKQQALAMTHQSKLKNQKGKHYPSHILLRSQTKTDIRIFTIA